jgi:hypothetical protein
MLAIVCFLFLPVAGCGSMTITGIDLIKMKDIDASVKLFAVIAMLCAVAIIFIPDKTLAFFNAVGGLISLLIAYLVMKGKMSSGDDFGMSNAIELKSGSYLSMLGFLISAVVSKVKNEFISIPISDPQIVNNNQSKTSNFCHSCGKVIENGKSLYCEHCGVKL